MSTGKLEAEWEGPAGSIYALACSPDGKFLAVGGGDEVIRLWNLAERTWSATLRAHGSTVTCLAFTRDGRRLISGALDSPVRIWVLDP